MPGKSTLDANNNNDNDILFITPFVALLHNIKQIDHNFM